MVSPDCQNSENDKLQTTQLQIVYVLTNPAMPGFVKIGHTKNSDAQLRIDQLYTTGVPLPFDLEFACKVQNAEEVEKALHAAFGPSRVNPKREFFKIDAKLLHTEDATQEVEAQPTTVDAVSLNASKQLKAKRPNMHFQEMGIEIGAPLVSIHNGETAIVCGPKKVNFQGEEMSLTAATKQVLGIEHSVQPSPHWTYQGTLLKDIYEETYSTETPMP